MQRYSKLFGKTERNAPKNAVLTSHKYLYQAGYIRESVAGRYFLLPLCIRVRDKIVSIIDEEMEKAGAQKMLAPTLHPLELWEETNRVNSSNFELMTLEDRRGARFALGGTAEEMISDVVRKFQLTYKDLPCNIYQFSTKFRDEIRAKGALLRTREFTMKDAYSFSRGEEDFEPEYQNMADTYARIYSRLGIKAIQVPADNGYFGGDYSDEFVVEDTAGESTFFVSEDGKYIAHEDIAKFSRGEINPEEEIQELKVIDQPEWVQTMEDNVKHYGKPASHFLKNVVYKNRTNGEIIIATIRGDLEVNKNKLEHVLDAVGQLDDATDADLASIGTKSGYVHSWGHNARYIGDISLTTVKNFIGGQKEEKTDTINVNYGRDFSCEMLADIALAKDGYSTEDGTSRLIVKKGTEVGNIFQLGTHYSQRMANLTFIDQDGKGKLLYMGCYGIGIERTLQAVVESNHDDKGIIWPDEIAPFAVHLLGLDLHDSDIRLKVESVLQAITNAGIEVLYDDREETRAGEKFNDADLIGIPWRVVVSKRTGDLLEVKRRNEEKSELMSLDDFIGKIMKK